MEGHSIVSCRLHPLPPLHLHVTKAIFLCQGGGRGARNGKGKERTLQRNGTPPSAAHPPRDAPNAPRTEHGTARTNPGAKTPFARTPTEPGRATVGTWRNSNAAPGERPWWGLKAGVVRGFGEPEKDPGRAHCPKPHAPLFLLGPPPVLRAPLRCIACDTGEERRLLLWVRWTWP